MEEDTQSEYFIKPTEEQEKRIQELYSMGKGGFLTWDTIVDALEQSSKNSFWDDSSLIERYRRRSEDE